MVENIELAIGFINGMAVDDLRRDTRSFYACIRCLEIISEASRRLDPAVIDQHPNIPWHAIKASGNVYRHEYNLVSVEWVHATISNDLPILLKALTE